MLLILNEGEDILFSVFGVDVDVDLAFTGKPANGGEKFFVGELSVFLQLLGTHSLSSVKHLPDSACISANSV